MNCGRCGHPIDGDTAASLAGPVHPGRCPAAPPDAFDELLQAVGELFAARRGWHTATNERASARRRGNTVASADATVAATRRLQQIYDRHTKDRP